MLFPSLQCVIWVPTHGKRSWKFTPREAPLSHRKHCFWNASSVVPPLTLCFCDITFGHPVTLLLNLCWAASLARKNWFSTAALLLLVVMGQVSVSWPIRGDWRRAVGWIHIGSDGAVKKAGFPKILMKVSVFDPNRWKIIGDAQDGHRNNHKNNLNVALRPLFTSDMLWSRRRGQHEMDWIYSSNVQVPEKTVLQYSTLVIVRAVF